MADKKKPSERKPRPARSPPRERERERESLRAPPRESGPYKAFLRGIPRDAEEGPLIDALRKYRVKRIRVSRFKGIGYAEFDRAEDLHDALRHGTMTYRDAVIQVSEDKSREIRKK